jgi:phosphoserine phosphatase
MADEIPLVTDLDGTLIKGDLLFISFGLLIKKNFLYAILCFFWLLKGRAYLKQQIYNRVQIKPDALEYNNEVVNFLKEEYAKGRKIVLATASVKKAALQIAAHQPFFSQVFGTDDNYNLKGKNKLQLLLNQYGKNGFDYIGDAAADVVIFEAARFSYLVNPSSATEQKTAKVATIKRIWRF